MNKGDDLKKNILFKEVSALGVALGRNFSADELAKLFEELNGYSLLDSAKEAGYQSIEELLLKCNRFQSARLCNKIIFRADFATRTKDIVDIPPHVEDTVDIPQHVEKQEVKKTEIENMDSSTRQYLNRAISSDKLKVRRDRHSKTMEYGPPDGFMLPQYSTSPLKIGINDEKKRMTNCPSAPTYGHSDGFSLPQCSESALEIKSNDENAVEGDKSRTEEESLVTFSLQRHTQI